MLMLSVLFWSQGQQMSQDRVNDPTKNLLKNLITLNEFLNYGHFQGSY